MMRYQISSSFEGIDCYCYGYLTFAAVVYHQLNTYKQVSGFGVRNLSGACVCVCVCVCVYEEEEEGGKVEPLKSMKKERGSYTTTRLGRK